MSQRTLTTIGIAISVIAAAAALLVNDWSEALAWASSCFAWMTVRNLEKFFP